MNLDGIRGSSSQVRQPRPLRRTAIAVAVICALSLGGCSSPNPSDSEGSSATNSDTSQSSPSASESAAQDGSAAASATEFPSRCQVPTAEEIGQMNQEQLASLAASLMTVGVQDFSDAETAVSNGAGGIFIGSWTDMGILNNQSANVAELQKRAAGRLMVTIDEEGGRVQRLSQQLGPLPAPAEMAATMTTDQVRELAKTHAEKMAALGLNTDLAPSADLAEADQTSVIGDRAFSSDPEVGAKYARAFAEGLTAGGVKSVVKHFPGHGSVEGDSHKGAVTAPPIDQLRQHDLLPFSVLTEQPAFMVGHMEVPGYGTAGPASLNPEVYKLLKEGGYPKLGGGAAPAFAGVVFTDDLSGMRAITDRMSVSDAVVQAIAAGADSPLWLGTSELPQAADAVATSVMNKQIPAQRLADARSRVAKFAGCN